MRQIFALVEAQVVVRIFMMWWHRIDPQPEYDKFSGNVLWHVLSCGSTTTSRE
ncbi:hypothetical protein ACFLR0_01275 [Candidatus Bipolaricaulota bacterium]